MFRLRSDGMPRVLGTPLLARRNKIAAKIAWMHRHFSSSFCYRVEKFYMTTFLTHY